jgi:hypothetical protein
MAELVAIQIKHLAASGVISANPCYMKSVCFMHKTGATGVIKFYNLTTAPGESDVAACEVDVVGVGMYSIPVPEPGALFDKGVYVVLPANCSINAFFKQV